MALSVITGTTTKVHNNASAASVPITLNQTPTPGNLLVVGISTGDTTPGSHMTLTDNQTGNTYTAVTSASRVILFYAKNIKASGTFTITLSDSSSAHYKAIFVYEVSGADKNTPFKTGESAVSTGTSDATTGAATSGTITNSNPNAILFGLATTAYASSPATVTPNTGAGWTIDTTNAQETDGVNYEVGGLAWLIVTTTNTGNTTWTLNTSIAFGIILAAFQAFTTMPMPLVNQPIIANDVQPL